MRGRRPPAASLPSLLSRGGYSGYGASWNKIEARQAYPISGRSSLDQIEPIGSARSINLIDCAPNAQSDRPANCRCRREQPVRAARASAPSSSIERARPPRSAWIPRFEGVEARCLPSAPQKGSNEALSPGFGRNVMQILPSKPRRKAIDRASKKMRCHLRRVGCARTEQRIETPTISRAACMRGVADG